MITYRKRTHTLVVEVPLFLDQSYTLDYDPVSDALRFVVSITRLAVDGVVCDDLTVTLRDDVTVPT